MPDTELNEKQRTELDALDNMADGEIDFSDIPETLDWSKGIRGAFRRLNATPTYCPDEAGSRSQSRNVRPRSDSDDGPPSGRERK